MPAQIRLAYYCSGHGYGHATRVSAFASSLLSLDENLEIYVVSSAPTHVFSECIRLGARYRFADIDPIIVQPVAYKVDRKKSVEVLQTFLSEKEKKLAIETTWLSSERIDCVLSDAAFLACEAATKACIPSILITNFTFDSVYSYLGAEIGDHVSQLPDDTLHITDPAALTHDIIKDPPIPSGVLEPLVKQLLAGYRHADILLLLPGYIPIPSFFQCISLPATAWVDPSTNRFRSEIESILQALPIAESALHPSIPFPFCIPCRKPPRTIRYAPLLVRPASPNVNTPEGRRKLLTSIGIPNTLHDPDQTQILLVSFGGQTIRRPHGGKSPSRPPSPFQEQNLFAASIPEYTPSNLTHFATLLPVASHDKPIASGPSRPTTMLSRQGSAKIFIPGAPAPANNPASPILPTSPPAPPMLHFLGPDGEHVSDIDAKSPTTPQLAYAEEEDEPSLLPSASWIAIICGVPSNWSISGEEEIENLPPGFYIAPRDVYMPDLTAVADVLLGKLGYGTVSESVAQATPFVYVPRPLFVEEHGLRLLLEAKGTGVELSHSEYESGNWAKKVEEAYLKGKRLRQATNITTNELEVRRLAGWVVENVRKWQEEKTRS